MNARWMLPVLVLVVSCTCTAQINGRISVSGSAANPVSGDIGRDGPVDVLNADQQGLRLMLDDSAGDLRWSLHVNTFRRHVKGIPAPEHHSSDLFRYQALSHDWRDDRGAYSRTRIGIELDHAYVNYDIGDFSLAAGRQPVDWGSGRFWQPMNVFGAFAPTDLDTEYKPGIDSVIVNGYPSAFSSVEAVYAFAPHDMAEINNSGAVYYRRQVGESSEMALLAGDVVDNPVFGASFESDWRGIGWRVEAVRYELNKPDDDAWFWIAGLDYQFDNGTLVSLEWYDNALGADSEASLGESQDSLFGRFGLKQHLSQRVLGLAFNRDVTPLLNANYSLLASPLENERGDTRVSTLHQLNFVYSTGDESEFLFSIQHASGRGLDAQNNPRSEFGHLPASITLIYRYYF